MKTIVTFLMLFLAGCATSSAARAPSAPLDGRSYRVTIAPERGGASETVELVFARGAIETSDGRADGFVPAPYAVDAGELAFESRSPSSVRRFHGRIEGDRLTGTMEMAPHGAVPSTYAVSGHLLVSAETSREQSRSGRVAGLRIGDAHEPSMSARSE